MLTLSILQTSINKADNTRGYDWTARVNYKVIACGKVKGHSREDGWQDLIQMILDNEKKLAGPLDK